MLLRSVCQTLAAKPWQLLEMKSLGMTTEYLVARVPPVQGRRAVFQLHHVIAVHHGPPEFMEPRISSRIELPLETLTPG